MIKDDPMNELGFDEVANLLAWLRNQLVKDERDVNDSRALSPGDLHWSMPDWLDRDHLLADIESKRRILEACEIAYVDSATDYDGTILAERVLRLMTVVYAYRPGYQESWRP